MLLFAKDLESVIPDCKLHNLPLKRQIMNKENKKIENVQYTYFHKVKSKSLFHTACLVRGNGCQPIFGLKLT